MGSALKFFLLCLIFSAVLWVTARIILPFFLPFLLGGALALGAEPLVSLLCRRLRLPRGLGAAAGVGITFLLGAGLLLSLTALLLQQLRSLSGLLPGLVPAVQSGVRLLENWLLGLTDLAPRGLEDLLQQNVRAFFSDGTAFLEKAAAHALSLAGGFLTHIPDRAFTLGTAILSGFMISAKLPGIRLWIRTNLRRDSLQPLLELLGRLRRTLGRWLLAQLKLSGVTFLLLTGSFILLAIPLAPVWALAVTALDMLPVLGTGTVLIPWSLISFLSGNRVLGLGLLSTYATVFLTRTLLEPRLVGRQLGLDPLVTLAALYIGYRLWGVLGMLVSPMLAVTLLQLFSSRGSAPGKED